MNVFGVGIPDLTKVKASNTANEIEPYMAQNRDAYLAGDRSLTSQANGLATFDALWNQFVQLESDPALGEAGKRGIQERGPTGTPSWGKNWFQLYREPIANDKAISAGVADSLSAGVSENMVPIVVALGAALIISRL
jgi:hypothetical protein